MKHEIRHNIIPLARSIYQEGYIKPAIDPLSLKYKPSSDEAFQVWHKNKPERNAIIGVLSDRIINRAIAAKPNHKPYGLVTINDTSETWETVLQIDDYDPFGKLQVHMRDTLGLALLQEISELEALSSKSRSGSVVPSSVSAYERFLKILEFRQKYVINRPISEANIELTIAEGLGTAVDVMSAALKVIPQVYRSKFPEDDMSTAVLLEIAGNSYPFIVGMAAQHQNTHDVQRTHVGRRVVFSFESFRFFPESFTLAASTNRLRLDFKEEVKQDIARDADEKLSVLSADYNDMLITTGCPALVPFNKESGIKKLWDWYLEIAEQIYPSIIDQTR